MCSNASQYLGIRRGDGRIVVEKGENLQVVRV